jgi:AsmA protein
MGGFERITGTSDLVLSFKGQGQSQAEIMKSLTGTGNYKILKGQLLGLDASTLLSGVDTALTERRLPDGLGLGRTTNFNDLIGDFSLNNGRATIRGFQLEAGSFFIDADGFIDIGDQTLDIGLRPKLTTGSDLAQFGIPLRFKGGFGAASPGLDTDF